MTLKRLIEKSCWKFLMFFKSMKILITGATGFIGKTLIPYMFNHTSKDLCLLVRNKDKAQNSFPEIENYAVITTEDHHWCEQLIEYSPDVVLHMATYFTGQCDAENIEALITTNISFTTFLLKAISQTNCKYFINIGTFSEYSNGVGEFLPNNLYSATKTAVRPIIKYFQTISTWNWINVIVYSPYGRRNTQKKVIDYMVDAIGTEKVVAFSPGEQILDFIHVDDIVDFFDVLIQKLNSLDKSFYEFHLGSGIGYSVREVGEMMEKVWNQKMNADWGGRDYSSSDIMHSVAPITNNITLLKWKAKITLKEGLEILRSDLIGHKKIEG